ncbi:MAG TPA: hypothetical protein VFF78_03360 [Anaerolineaceae bacterium]|nr:hypothetical protein [Anaerolineaceae bacterium]
MSEAHLRRLIEQQFARKQDVLRAAPAVMGDGQGNVDAGGGMVYVRMVDQAFTVLNRRAPLINELPVWIGEDPLQPGTIQVLSARETGLERGSSSEPLTIDHGSSHSYPNRDTIWVYLEQFMPFRLVISGLGLILYGRPVWNGTEYVDVPVTDPDAPINMAAHIPVVSGKAAWVLITISTTGAVVETKGSEVDLVDLVLGDIPASPSGTAYTLAAVRVYCGQERIVRSREGSDILDLRFPMRHTHAAADLPATLPPSTHGSSHAGTGDDPVPDVVAAGASGLMTGADKTKLDGLGAGLSKFAAGVPAEDAGVQIDIAHGLGTADLTVSVRITATGEIVYPDIAVTSTYVSLTFSVAVTENEYSVVVIG